MAAYNYTYWNPCMYMYDDYLVNTQWTYVQPDQHARKDLSYGPGLVHSVSQLPNQQGREAECFGPVSGRGEGWGNIWGSMHHQFKSCWGRHVSFILSSLFHAHNKAGLSLWVVNHNTCYAWVCLIGPYSVNVYIIDELVCYICIHVILLQLQ